jgi:hypothetical protein
MERRRLSVAETRHEYRAVDEAGSRHRTDLNYGAISAGEKNVDETGKETSD